MITSLFQPSGFAYLLLLLALSLAFFKSLRRYSFFIFTFSAVIFLIFSTGTMASLLLSPLEYRYPILDDTRLYPDINRIVVLTGGAEDDHNMPLSSRVNTASAYRLLETQNIYRQCNCTIYLSGGEIAVKVMAEILLTMGIAEDKLIQDSKALHTYHSAENLSEVLKTESFYLITSAGHMPRAMGVFQKQGLNPVAVPTEFQMPEDFSRASLQLSPLHLYWSDLAVHEYAGIVWYKLTNRI